MVQWESDCAARPCAAAADHKGVLTQVAFKIPGTATHQREVWHFRDADWERMARTIDETNPKDHASMAHREK